MNFELLLIIIRVFFRTSKAASRFSNNCESASKRIFGFSILNFWLFKFSILNFRLSVFRAVSPTGQNSPQHVTVLSGIFFSVPSCSGFSLYLQTRGLQTENLQVAYAYREVGEGKRMQEETGRRPEAGGRDRFRQIPTDSDRFRVAMAGHGSFPMRVVGSPMTNNLVRTNHTGYYLVSDI